MVIGEIDAGKTTFCTQCANAALAAGLRVAIVDADVGQSEIGPPGTIGMGTAEAPVETLSDVKPKRLHFVGATSPAGHLLDCCAGARKMVDAAAESNADLIILDTTGFVDGFLGRKLKTSKADLVRPDCIVAVQRGKEVEHLLAPFARMESVELLRVPASPLARKKPQELRAARRRANFSSHFSGASTHIIRLDEVSTWNSLFGTGRPMKWQYMKFMQDALKCRILHAEVSAKGVFAVVEQRCSRSGLREIEEEFKTTNVVVVPDEALNNLLVGLADGSGSTLDVGLIEAVDFQQRIAFVVSPIKTVSPVRVIQFGSIRVNREGRELGTLAPGTI